jgi:hypothetical protein
MTLLTSAGFPPTAGPLFTTQLSVLGTNAVRINADYTQEVALRSSGKTIGVAGASFFGVGAAIKNGAPDAVSVNDYFPTHAASGSFM